MIEQKVLVSRFVAVALVLVMCLSVARVAGDRQTAEQSVSIEVTSDGYVRAGWLSDVYSWNPLAAVMEEDYVVSSLIHSSLFTYDQDYGGPVGDLAVNWSMYAQADGTMDTYITVTNNAYFRNMANPEDMSRQLTAQDVKYTLDVIMANPGNSYDLRLRDVYQVDVLGDYSVVVRTSEVSATLIDDLTGVPILPKYLYQSMNDPLADIDPDELVGSGPFMFQDMMDEGWYMFATAPNYHGAEDYPATRTVSVPGIIFTVYSSSTSLALAMNDGQMDVISLGTDIRAYMDVLGYGATVNVVKQAAPEPGICDVAINAIPMSFRTTSYGKGNLHLLDPAVRQAILMTLNKDYIVSVLLQDTAIQGDSVIQPGFWQASIDDLPFDPSAAKALLMDNGYSADADGDGYLEATVDAYVVRAGLLPAGSELSGIRCQAPDTDPTYGYTTIAWKGWADQAGIGLISSIESEITMINMAWYKADYDIWVWHWGWDQEPLGSALPIWLTSEIVPGGTNCQMPMGPWWYGPSNYTEAPAEWGLTGPYSAYDQNLSLARKTLDIDERKVLVDKLQQWIFDSYTESPPFYDFCLYGVTDARFVGWGDWTMHPGRAMMSCLLWLWFDLEPASGNYPPTFDMPLLPSYEAAVGEPMTFEVAVSDPEGSGLFVNWSFGDGGTASVVLTGDTTIPTTVVQTHTYTSPANGLELWVSVDDAFPGHKVFTISSVDVVSPGQRTVGYWWHNMFNEPFGEWWDMRYDYYYTWEVVSDTYPYVYRVNNASDSTYYSNMRLNVMTDSLPEINMNSNPQFLPYLGDERGGTAIIDWYMQYLTEDEMQRYPDHSASWYDGWVVSLNGTTFLDSVAAKSVLGISDLGLSDFDAWWAANRFNVQTAYVQWLLYEGNDRLDIWPMYDYSFMPLSFNLDAYSYDGNVVLTYDIVSWGMEALMTRWLHEAFMPTEWYFEDFTLHAEIFPDLADIDVDTSVVGALFAWKDISTGIPSWGWRGMLQDYVPSNPMHPDSDFDTYDDLEYLDMYAGSTWYGKMIPYGYTPGSFDLAEGEEMWFEWPDGPQTFIVDGMFRDYTTADYPMTSPYSEPSPSDLPSSVSVDTASRTIRFEGPMDVYSWSEAQTSHGYLESEWDRLGVLPYGMPWIEFRADAPAPEPEPPVAMIGELPPLPLVGEPVTFDGSGSYDPDGDIVGYAWEFGDGYVDYGPTVTHAYAHDGIYEIVLTVMDEDGLTDTHSVNLTVASVPTATMIFLPLVPSVGELVTFDASLSYDESGILGCTWDFGDGMNASGWVVDHAYIERGDYPVTLTVTNTYGVQASDTKIVEVGAIGSGVRGKVVSESLRPLRNAEVGVVLMGVTVGSAQTNGAGEFEIRGLIPGDYDLVVSKNGYPDATIEITVKKGVLDVGTIVLTRDKSALTSLALIPDGLPPLVVIVALLTICAAAGLFVHRRKYGDCPA